MMKKLILMTALLSFALVGTASATIGWAGSVWPNSGSDVTPVSPVDCYVQVWKDGVTTVSDDQGADIAVFADITNDIGGSLLDVVGTYLGDAGGGSNDEYTVQIPQSMLLGATTVTIQFKVHDLSDDTWYDAIGDQAGNPAPQTYNIVDVLPNDIDVTFTLCMSGEAFTDGPCVVGSDPAINSWGPGVTMTSLGGDLFEVVVTFLAGSNPTFEYKYQKNLCADWESIGNRVVTLPNDGTTALALEADSWNNLPIGCGLGDVLSEDKTVCFQVCVDAVGTTGGVCVIGNTAELDNWASGVPATEIGPGLYQTCVIFPAGSPFPINLEYKFKKDDCATWESVGNRLFTVDDSVATETTLTHNWEDGEGACAPVANVNASFSTIKSLYR